MHAVVRCPECDGLSSVPADALGLTVHCPRCDESFVARPEAAPRGRTPDPRPPVRAPAVPVVHPARHTDPDRHEPTSALVGLALLPLGVPLVWVIAPLLTGVEPVFSYALPVAIALGVSGLCLGVAFTQDWTHPGRVKGILALVLLGYAAAAFLFFVQKDWLETARRRFGGTALRWHEFTPDDGTFRVRLPGKVAPAPAAEPVPGWKLRAYQCIDPKQRTSDVYVVAYGPPPDAVAGLADDAFFAAVKEAVGRAAGGAEPTETPITQQGHPGREFALELDKVTNRTVRVVRVGKRAFYLAAEGVALTADTPDVKRFFDSFYLKQK